MKKYLVTGGNGFIGSHMCQLLNKLGHEVVIVDNHSTSPKVPTHNFGSFYNQDIDSVKTKKLLKDFRPDCVFHFAALASIRAGEQNPTLYFKENVTKTVNLINSCIDTGIENFIFSSTCATFGNPQKEKINEEHPQSPINTYGKTKLMVERTLQEVTRKKLINSVVFRYFNAAGASPDAVIGEHNLKNDRLIPNICNKLMKNQKISIYGDQYNTPDGTCVRDYIHVEDLVQAHLDGAIFLADNHGFHDFNLGSAQGYSVKEVIDTAFRVANKKTEVIIESARIGDPPLLIADSSKAKKQLGFQTRYNLQECIQHALNFYKSIQL